MGACVSDENNDSNPDWKTQNSAPTKRKIYKLLLLGAGQSGKSTLCKHMQHLKGDGFTRAEKYDLIPIMRSNTVGYMQTLYTETINHADEKKKLQIPKELKNAFEEIERDEENLFKLSEDLAQKIAELWKCEAIQDTFKRRSEFQLDDSAEYFIEKAETLASSKYFPSEDDIIRNRVQTVGIIHTNVKFTVQDTEFEMIDVGGQQSERRKWGSAYSNISAVVFVCALSGYDSTILEDEKTNRLEESLELFATVVYNKELKDKPIILFLNKFDLFEQKIREERTPITVCPLCKDYTGSPDSTKESVRYIEKLFKGRVGKKRELFVHRTVAIDKRNVLKVFQSVKQSVLQEFLQEAGLIRI
mmetsp:Transcript_34357/g.58196  ORF Transcript_34357/g.58196 Transcript_34357/m.58196 type:complete len:359 (+) Transcript_34357:49-1125(+)